MGYRTYFTIDILDKEGNSTGSSCNHIIRNIRKINDWASCAFTDDGFSQEDVKWYNHQEDLLEISKMFPDNILMVHGDGEESNDYWVDYYMNGKVQHCVGKITYEPLDLDLITTKKFKRRKLK